MARISEFQALLLGTAATRRSGSLYPLPAGITDDPARLARAVTSLTTRELLKQRPTRVARDTAHEQDGERYGLYITHAGLAAISAEVEQEREEEKHGQDDPASPSPTPRRQSKTDMVLALLRRPSGATLAELIAATGWLPHSTRAALTGLRKKGHGVEKRSVEGVTRYHAAGDSL